MVSKNYKRGEKIWALTRISLGLIFLWAFFDKLIGLGFATCRDAESGITSVMCNSAWLNGGSPTFGFLSFATKGPFAELFKSLAGVGIVDWLFMLGLLGIGLTLTFGFMVRIGSYSGALMLVLMWLAVLPPGHHPFLNDHIIYALVLIGLSLVNAGDKWGIGKWWSNQKFVKNNPFWK
tara:strand:+ start:9415 stop:9948 length:534 start_codon:yes stop_codon:yes gene_type:complete